MHTLNIPAFDAKITTREGKRYIFDRLRKKYVRLQPEEWVRQHIVHYLIEELGYPPALLKVEGSRSGMGASNRKADIIVFDNRQGSPLMLIECKAAYQVVGAPALAQIACYNRIFKVPYLVLTNGMQHLVYQIDMKAKNYKLLEGIPRFDILQSC